MSKLDPAQTRSAARRLDAYLTQFLPDWYFDPGSLFTGWGITRQAGPPAYPLAAAGWVLGCSGTPSISFPQHKVVTHTITTAWLCAPVEEANFGGTLQAGGYGVAAIPAGVRTVSFPWGNSAVQIKGQNSERWNYPGGGVSPAPVTFSAGVGAIVLPIEDPFLMPEPATQMAYAPRTGARAAVFEFMFSTGGSGVTRRPPAPPVPAPPGKGVKEQKWKLGNGGAAGRSFGALTELDDALECAYKASGGKGNTGLPQMAKHVARNFDISDPKMVADTIRCMALSGLSDLVVGRANRAASKAFGRASGSPRGIGIKRAPSPFGSSTSMR